MTESRELQELKRKRKEIDEQINLLLRKEIQFGRAKFGCEHFPSMRADEWCISIKCLLPDPYVEGAKKREIWRAVARNTDKAGVIEELHGIIGDLVKLEVELREGEE